MAEVIASTTAADVISDVVTTLKSATIGGVPVFFDVLVTDDIDGFKDVADPLKGCFAGVISKPTQRALSEDNSCDEVERLSFDLAVLGMSLRDVGDDELDGVNLAQRLADIARAALSADPSRGGRCDLIKFRGQMIAGTDVSGDSRVIPPAKNESFYTAVVPVVIGWQVN